MSRVKYVVVFLVVALVYLGSNYSGASIYDDRPNIFENAAIHTFSPGDLSSWWSAAFESPARFRPVSNLSFAWDWYLWGENLVAFHVVSDLFHALSAIALFFVLTQLLAMHCREEFDESTRQKLAMLGALLWALHPVQTSAVTYLVQRMTVMSGLFSFAAIGFYLRGRASGETRPYAWAAAAYLLALLSKESAATLPVVLMAYEWLFPDSGEQRLKRTRWIGLAAACVPPLLIAGIYAATSGDHFGAGTLPGRDFTLYERVLSAPRVYLRYLGLLIFPLNQALDYGLAPSRGLLAPWTVIPSVIGFVALFACSIAFRKRWPLACFSVLFFILTLAPESTFLNLELFFEHRLYVASAFLLGLLPVGLWVLAQSRQWDAKPVTVALVLILLAAGTATAARNQAWSSVARLMESNVRARPENARARVVLAEAYLSEKKLSKAEGQLKEVLKLDSKNVAARTNLGVVAAATGDRRSAMEHYLAALSLDPGYELAHYNLGVLLIEQEDYRRALEPLRRAIELKPNSSESHFQLGVALAHLGQPSVALSEFRRAVQLDPGSSRAHFNLARLLSDRGRLEEAAKHYQRAAAGQSQQAEALVNLGANLLREKKYSEAIGQLEMALAMNPRLPDGQYNLGIAYALSGNEAKAVEHFQAACDLGDREGCAQVVRIQQTRP